MGMQSRESDEAALASDDDGDGSSGGKSSLLSKPPSSPSKAATERGGSLSHVEARLRSIASRPSASPISFNPSGIAFFVERRGPPTPGSIATGAPPSSHPLHDPRYPPASYRPAHPQQHSPGAPPRHVHSMHREMLAQMRPQMHPSMHPQMNPQMHPHALAQMCEDHTPVSFQVRDPLTDEDGP